MKQLQNNLKLKIPEGVEVTIKSRKVVVKGKHGTLERTFKHIHADIRLSEDKSEVVITMWHATTKVLSCLRTVASHITNMMTGVTQRFEFKMRLVYSHFPINVTITK